MDSKKNELGQNETLRSLMDKILLALPDGATDMRQAIAMFMVKQDLLPRRLDRKSVEKALGLGSDYKTHAREYLDVLKREHDDDGCDCLKEEKKPCKHGYRIMDLLESLNRSDPPSWVFLDNKTNGTLCKRCGKTDPMPDLPMDAGAFIFLMMVTAANHRDCEEKDVGQSAAGADEHGDRPDQGQPAADVGGDSSEERTDGGGGTGSSGA